MLWDCLSALSSPQERKFCSDGQKLHKANIKAKARQGKYQNFLV